MISNLDNSYCSIFFRPVVSHISCEIYYCSQGLLGFDSEILKEAVNLYSLFLSATQSLFAVSATKLSKGKITSGSIKKHMLWREKSGDAQEKDVRELTQLHLTFKATSCLFMRRKNHSIVIIQAVEKCLQ